jgi:hypothetical protein
MHAALEQNLVAAQFHGFADLGFQFVAREHVALRVAGGAKKAQKRQPDTQTLCS